MNEKLDDKVTDISEARANKANKENKNRVAESIGKMATQQRDIDNDKLKSALQRILNQAHGDHGGAKRCAAFLLSLWNGGFYKADLQELMYSDPDLYEAMLYILSLRLRRQTHPDPHEQRRRYSDYTWGAICQISDRVLC